MDKYHKIHTIYKRDPETKFKNLLIGEYSKPEFEYLKNNQWVFTEKVDGTNIRIMFDGEKITFGGKTDRAQIPADLVNRLNGLFKPMESEFKEIFGHPICMYGEGYGPKIQKGGGNYKEHVDFVLFDIKIEEYWLERENLEGIAHKLGIDIAPVIGSGPLSRAIDMCQKGFESTWGNFEAEGLVCRPSVEFRTRKNKRIITKIKCRDFKGTK
jgi:hypothetical protein